MVSPLDVGETGTVTIEAGAAITLGGTVKAGTLNVTAGEDLTITSDVGTLTVHMTSTGDLTVFQTGALTIQSITMAGGDITLIADDDIMIGKIEGTAGDVTIQSRHGSIQIDRLDSAGHVSLQAAGDVTATLEADTLDVVTDGDVIIHEHDGFLLERMDTGGGSVLITTGDAVGSAAAVANAVLVVNAAIVGELDSTVSLTASGAIDLKQSITTAFGAITSARRGPDDGRGGRHHHGQR